MNLSRLILRNAATPPEPKPAADKPAPSSQPSEQARRWDNAVPRKRRCGECGFLLGARGECAMGCSDVKTWEGDQA